MADTVVVAVVVVAAVVVVRLTRNTHRQNQTQNRSPLKQFRILH